MGHGGEPLVNIEGLPDDNLGIYFRIKWIMPPGVCGDLFIHHSGTSAENWGPYNSWNTLLYTFAGYHSRLWKFPGYKKHESKWHGPL